MRYTIVNINCVQESVAVNPSKYTITICAISKLLEMFHGNLKSPENSGMGLSNSAELQRSLPWNLPCFYLVHDALASPNKSMLCPN